jgi:hypothetical protein
VRHAAWLVVVIACSKSGEHGEREPAPAPHHEDRHEPAIAAPSLDLAVTIDGVRATWHRDELERAPRGSGTNNEGAARDTWSLRELVHRNVGPTARVVAVAGASRKVIDADAWSDTARTPILHTTRRGTLKFRWADATGAWGETEVKDVTQLEIVR